MLKRIMLRASENRKLIKYTAKVYKIIKWVFNEKVADIYIYILSRLLFSSPGLTFTRYGYYNPYSYKFIWEVQEYDRKSNLAYHMEKKRELNEFPQVLKVGIFGSLMTPNKDFFQCLPQNFSLYCYDVQTKDGYRAIWLEKNCKDYYCATLNGNPTNLTSKERHPGWDNYIPISRTEYDKEKELANLSSKINEDQLDILVHIGGIDKNWDELINLINTPVIINYATGSIISFNERVSADLFSQPQLYYHIRNDFVYCSILKRNFTKIKAYETHFAFNHRDIRQDANIPFSERKNRIIYFGNLYKLNNKRVLSVIKQLLDENADFTFLFFGSEQENEIKKIKRYFNKSNLLGKIQYIGTFSNMPSASGEYNCDSWNNMVEIVRDSKLFIDAWPICGGNSVFQAYAMGVPVVSLKLIEDNTYKIDNEKTSVAVAGLNLTCNTADNWSEYLSICKKILEDEMFANKVIAEQYQQVSELTNYPSLWGQIDKVFNDNFGVE